MFTEERNKLNLNRKKDIVFPEIKIPKGKKLDGKMPKYLRGR